MGDYVRWSPPYYEGAERDRARRAVPGAEPGQAIDPHRPQDTSAARRCCCGWRATPTCCWSRSGPACSTASGSATSACGRRTPGLVYCAITGYGQDGPNRDRSGHDMNYLGLNGLLALTGEADGPPVQVGGPDRGHRRRGADGGGGGAGGAARARALGRGPVRRLLDVRRRAVVAGAWWWPRRSPRGRRARRGEVQLAGALTCYRPYSAPTGTSRWARWSRSSGAHGARAWAART